MALVSTMQSLRQVGEPVISQCLRTWYVQLKNVHVSWGAASQLVEAQWSQRCGAMAFDDASVVQAGTFWTSYADGYMPLFNSTSRSISLDSFLALAVMHGACMRVAPLQHDTEFGLSLPVSDALD